MKYKHELLQFFGYTHLPSGLATVSRPFGELAEKLDLELPDGTEKTTALRKLLESKDCAVRAALTQNRPTVAPLGTQGDACQTA